MASDLNQCSFIGRLGKDPESRFKPDGKQITSFSMAVSGYKKDETEWVRVVAFDKLAEICSTYLTKGSRIYLSGRMKTDKWTDKEGVERYSTNIIADKMQMLDGKKDASQPEVEQHKDPASDFSGMDSDIPF